MDLRQLEAKLIELQRRLDDKKDSRRKAKKDLDKWEEAVSVIQKSLKEMEEKIQEGLNVIRTRLDRLMGGNRFKETYLNSITQILNGDKGTKVTNILKEAERKAKNNVLNLDDKIERYNKEIKNLENEMTALRGQLNSLGGEV